MCVREREKEKKKRETHTQTEREGHKQNDRDSGGRRQDSFQEEWPWCESTSLENWCYLSQIGSLKFA